MKFIINIFAFICVDISNIYGFCYGYTIEKNLYYQKEYTYW